MLSAGAGLAEMAGSSAGSTPTWLELIREQARMRKVLKRDRHVRYTACRWNQLFGSQ